MTGIATHLRRTFQALGRRPGYTATAVVTLALGIGANVALFSAVRTVLLEPLPFPNADRVAQVYPLDDGHRSAWSPPNFVDHRAQTDAFSSFSAFVEEGFVLSFDDAPSEVVPGASVTGDFFEVLGVPPALGRGFRAEELEPGGERVAILSHGLWQRRFGGDAKVLGRSAELDGRPATVVGVMPEGFGFPAGAEVWTPRVFNHEDLTTQRGAHYLAAVARLAPGATLESANVQTRAVAERLEREYPKNNTGRSAEAVPLLEAIVGPYRPALAMLLGAAGLVLLIACANVANLLLARILERRRELAVRSALGAAPAGLLRGVLWESLVLTLLGGLAALGVAALGVELIASLDSLEVPRLADTTLDPAALAFGLLLTALTALVAGAVPAARLAAARSLHSELGSGVRSTGDRASHRLRGLLVAAEIALAVVLLFGAGLLARSFLSLRNVDPGFEPKGVLSVRTFVNEEDYPEPEQVVSLAHRIDERLEALPGVERAALVMGLPLSGMNFVISVEGLDGAPAYEEPGTEEYVRLRVVSPDYFRTMGIPVRSGRAFTADDRRGTRPVVVVNETAARKLWPAEEALGHTIEVGTSLGVGEERAGGEVVGVVGDVLADSLSRDAPAEVYVSHDQFPIDWFSLVLDTPREPAALVEEVRAALREIDPRLAVHRPRTMEQWLAGSVAHNRVYTLLLGLFAATAVLLAAVGIFGVVAYAASQRTREVGIRMALGATRGRIVGLMLRQGLGVTFAGAVVGALAALSLGGFLRSWLYGLEPTDPATLAGAALFLMAVTLAASLAPAREAARTDPARTLRRE